MDESGNRQFLECRDRQIVTELLENVNEALKDSDAQEEKELVKRFLRDVSSHYQFVVMGSTGTGKSRLLNELFGKTLYGDADIPHTVGFREYRYGGENKEFLIEKDRVRIFCSAEELEGISVIDTQGIEELEAADGTEKMKQLIRQSDVLIVVFSAENIKDFAVWDLLEEADARKVLFVIAKSDLLDEERLRICCDRVAEYMGESRIQAPVFTVSAQETDGFGCQGTKGLEKVRDYINQTIIGPNPALTKQRENIAELKQLLQNLSSSFALRKKQHEVDQKILGKINVSMDSFFANNRFLIDSLKQELKREIEREIDAYQNEIVAKLDPKQIKERFAGGSKEFTNYLNFIHDGYRQRMTERVNQRTQGAIRTYLTGLEQVFEEATGYFRKREILIALEDTFYGSLAESKRYMGMRAVESIKTTQDYYHALMDASSELFIKIWNARNEYDKKVSTAQALGGAAQVLGGTVGAALGGGAAVLLPHLAAGAGTAAAAGAGVTAGAVLWPIVGMLAGGLVIAKIAKNIANARSLPELEESVRKSIEEFRFEVAKNKAAMTGEILDTIEAIFKRELDTADKTFLDFRMSINIDSRNIPVLEERMRKIDGYLQQIEEMERIGMMV